VCVPPPPPRLQGRRAQRPCWAAEAAPPRAAKLHSTALETPPKGHAWPCAPPGPGGDDPYGRKRSRGRERWGQGERKGTGGSERGGT
jgi:hypothetical protein